MYISTELVIYSPYTKKIATCSILHLLHSSPSVFLCWKHSGGVWPCCSTEDLGPVVSHPSWVMKRPQMVLIDDLSIANGASSLEFFEHQPCLLLKRYETWFIYSDQLVDFHKTNQPDGSTSIQGIYYESQKLKQQCIRIHQQSCQSSASKIFLSARFQRILLPTSPRNRL